VTDGTRAWVRSLPLLLMSSFLMLGAAWAFFQGKDNVASIAAFSAGLLLLGAWLATAIIDWHEGHAQVAIITKEEDDGESA
jgi:hypothetical protein